MKKQIITVVLLLFVGVSIVIAMSDVAGWRTNNKTDEATAANSNIAGVVSQQKDGLTAIYFHAKRCPTCEKIEAFAHESLKTEIEQGNIGWAVADYTKQENQVAVEHCKVLASTVVLVDLKDGEIVRWKNLEKVWDYTHDQDAFESYINKSWAEFRNAG